MLIRDRDFGRIEVRNISLPEEMEDIFGTYTCSGRVLISYHTSKDPDVSDWYNVAGIDEDGTNLRKVFSGVIPRIEGANGVRWMCFSDNRRILLGDYIMECDPDMDHCEKAELERVIYPPELTNAKDIFCRWSEVIIAPDNTHMCWTALTGNGATNYLGRLVRQKDCYILKDVCIISSTELCKPDPEHKGCVIPLPVRGGEVKQFIRGGRALTMVGNGDSITESVVQSLENEEILPITDSPGYEETTIFSPDERLGMVMSPRFSGKTNCAVFGLVPQPHSMVIRSKIINILYMYCVAGVRAFRKGNVGPALIDIQRSRRKGRSYLGVDLSDPEGKWVYYSPISWHPDSSHAMWNERTRPADGPQKCRLRMCRLLDYTPGQTVPVCSTPGPDQIPYARPAHDPKQQSFHNPLPMKIMGKSSGYVINECNADNPETYIAAYDNFSDDGKTFYNGQLTVTAPPSMFSMGRTVLEVNLDVKGEHNGEMKLRAVFERKNADAPAMLSFAVGEDDLPESHGWSTYDGTTLRIEDMEP